MESKNTSYLAIYTTDDIAEVVSLYASVFSMSKSTIIRDLLEKWIKTNGLTRAKLIKAFAERINYQWKLYDTQQKVDKRKLQMNKQEFLDRKRRLHKSLPDNTVDEALKLCGYEKN